MKRIWQARSQHFQAFWLAESKWFAAFLVSGDFPAEKGSTVTNGCQPQSETIP